MPFSMENSIPLTKHKKKMLAPIVVTILVVLYYILYCALIINVVHGVVGILFGIIPFVLGVTMIFICKQRIDEIRSGEEDDLSKY